MSHLSEKILKSGLIDRHTAALLEKYGITEPGSSEKVPEGNPLADATRQQLTRLAQDLINEAEKNQELHETMLDLEKLRWPVWVHVMTAGGAPISPRGLSGVIDRMGRYYFRAQDVKEDWFVPGYLIRRGVEGRDETILEVSPLHIGEALVCYQVSVDAR